MEGRKGEGKGEREEKERSAYQDEAPLTKILNTLLCAAQTTMSRNVKNVNYYCKIV